MYDKTYCPNCKTLNWVYLGDMDDCSAPDVEGIICRSCNEAYPVGGEETIFIIGCCNVTFEDNYDGQYETQFKEFVELLSKGKKWRDKTLSEVLKEYAYCVEGTETP